jgi:MFS family permease
VEHFWWGSVFLVNVPICIVAIVAGRFFVPTTPRDPEHALDPYGAVFSILGLMGLLYAIIEIPDRGLADTVVLVSLAVGVVFVGAFAYWETHYQHPMLDLRFFRNPRFTAASATITLTFFALYGSTFLLTQYFQFVLGYSPFKAGMLTAPIAIGIMGVAPQAPKLVEIIGTKLVVMMGLVVVATGLFSYSIEPIMSSFVGGGLVRLWFGIGMGLIMAPATESIMGSLPKAKAGVGSAVNDTTRQTGGAMGVAVVGSVFAATYHRVITVPANLPGDAPAMVHDSIGKALDAIRQYQLPADVAIKVHDTASDAFFRGMQVAAWVGTVVVFGAVFVAFKWLPARAERAVHEDADLAAEAKELAVLDDGIYT